MFYQKDIDTFLIGDVNLDGKEDTAFVTSPLYKIGNAIDTIEGCKDDTCLTIIHFNFDSTILFHNGALGCQSVFSVEDLNLDGIKEISLIPNWFTSCWQGLFVYSLKDKK